MKKGGVYIFITVLFILSGYLLLVLSELIPNSLIKDNVIASSRDLYIQSDQPSLYLGDAFLENFCDADYLAVAYNQRSANPFFNALDAFNYCYDKKDGSARGVIAFYQSFTDNLTKIYEHSHAWHGYRIFVRPLLIRYNVSDIRWLLATSCMCCVIIICILISKITGKIYHCIPFAFGFFYFNFQLETLSLAICINTLLMLVPCIVILIGILNNKDFLFFCRCMYVTGLCSAYFALCDLPLLSIGFTCIFILAYHDFATENRTVKMLILLFNWFAGYAIEGGLKFAIHAFFMHLGNAKKALIWYTGIYHSVTFEKRTIQATCLISEFLSYNRIAGNLLLGLIVLGLFYLIISKKIRAVRIADILPYIFIALLPVFWSMIMVIASNIKWTVFNFSITVFAVVQCLFSIIFIKEAP